MYILRLVVDDPILRDLYRARLEAGYDGDAGFDLLVPTDTVYRPWQSQVIDHGVRTEMICTATGEPVSFYLYPRSSLCRTPLRLDNSVGVIDSGYRGTIRASFTALPVDGFFQEDRPEYTVAAHSRLVQICAPTLNPIRVEILGDFCETITIFSFTDLLSLGRRLLEKHRMGLAEDDRLLPEELDHTGLDWRCVGAAWERIHALNEFMFTTGSTNTFEVDEASPEPMWVSGWMPRSTAMGLIAILLSKNLPISSLVQNLDTGEVLYNSIDPAVHRFWSAEGLSEVELCRPRIYLRQCTDEFAQRCTALFRQDDPVVGVWWEADDETSRDLYDTLLSIFRETAPRASSQRGSRGFGSSGV